MGLLGAAVQLQAARSGPTRLGVRIQPKCQILFPCLPRPAHPLSCQSPQASLTFSARGWVWAQGGKCISLHRPPRLPKWHKCFLQRISDTRRLAHTTCAGLECPPNWALRCLQEDTVWLKLGESWDKTFGFPLYLPLNLISALNYLCYRAIVFEPLLVISSMILI